MAKKSKDLPLIVDQKTAAKLLGISESTIWRWRKSGQIKAIPQFKLPKYAVADLQMLSGKPLQEAA